MLAFVANADSDSVSVVDANTDTVVDTVEDVGTAPSGLALTADRQTLLVANAVSDDIAVIDVAGRAVVPPAIAIPGCPMPASGEGGCAPTGIAITPDGSLAFVAARASDQVIVVDTSSRQVVSVIDLPDCPSGGCAPTHVAIARDGSVAYVANSGTDQAPGTTLSVIETTLAVVLPESAVIETIDLRCPGIGCGPQGLAITPDGTSLLVANADADTVTVIDTTDDAVRTTIPLSAGARPDDVAFAATANGLRAVVSNEGNDSVSLIDVAGASVLVSVDIPPAFCPLSGCLPSAVAATRDGMRAYVTVAGAPDPPEARGSTVAVFDVAAQAFAPDAVVVGSSPLAVTVDSFPRVTIALGTDSAAAGQVASIDVTLSAIGTDVVGTQNDVVFTSDLRIAAGPNGDPDCAVDAAIGKSLSAAFFPDGCAATDCLGVRAIVFAVDDTEPIPDGSVLYSCNVEVAANAAPGTSDLPCDLARYSPPPPAPVPAPEAACTAARITVLP